MHTLDLTIEREHLASLPKELQTDAMRSWFFERFEDPVHRTPYETREGGYLFIWGGPFEADDQLFTEFGEFVADDLIQELVDELNDESLLWAPVSKPEDYDQFDDEYSNVILDDTLLYRDCHAELTSDLDDIKTLLGVDVQPSVQCKYWSLLYCNVITALETFLGDTFAQNVLGDDALLRKYVETSRTFKDTKVSLSNVLSVAETLDARVRTELANFVWHNLGRVIGMYKATLGVTFADTSPLFSAVTKRHDFVHRNGRDKDQNEVTVDRHEVETLIDIVTKFAKHIGSQLGDRLEF